MNGHDWLIFVLLNNSVWIVVACLINNSWYRLATKHAREWRHCTVGHLATIDAMDAMDSLSRCECGRRYDKCSECEAAP